MTVKELIQRAVSIARQGLPTPLPIDAMEAAAEPLLPIVFAEVGERAARDERLRRTLFRAKAFAFNGGPETLPSDVLTGYLDMSVLFDPDDPTKIYSWVPWNQFISTQLDTRLGYYTLEGESLRFHLVEPGIAFDPTTGPIITVTLYTPCSPEIPATITEHIAVTGEVLDDLLAALSVALKMNANVQ